MVIDTVRGQMLLEDRGQLRRARHATGVGWCPVFELSLAVQARRAEASDLACCFPTLLTDDIEVLMTQPGRPPVLVTGATGQIGRGVVDLLLDAGMPVRALTRPFEAATLPANVDVVTGDLTVPESLDEALDGVGAVFLVWTAPPETAPAVVERLAAQARRVVFLSAPHQTPHPFFQQPNPMAVLYAQIEQLITSTRAGVDFRPARHVRVERAALVGARDPCG